MNKTSIFQKRLISFGFFLFLIIFVSYSKVVN